MIKRSGDVIDNWNFINGENDFAEKSLKVAIRGPSTSVDRNDVSLSKVAIQQ